MNRVLRISPGDRFLECEAGITNAEVQRACAAHGLFWAPDPTSAEYSTVGGNLACNAGGPRAVKYGTARDNVLGLRAIAGTGQSLRTGTATTKGAVGYDLTRLLVGSEGTLAVITHAILKLLPLPSHRRTLRAGFTGVDEAAAAVAAVMTQPHIPCALEFMDQAAVGLACGYRDVGVEAAVGALLILEVDGDAEMVERSEQALAETLRASPGLVELKTAATAEEAQLLWTARKALSPALRQLAPLKVNEDVVVPVTRIPELVRGLQTLSAEFAIPIVNFGHAGNGNLHVNLLLDPAERRQADALEPCLAAVFRLVLSLEGSLSGEHGVGLAKRPYVAWEIDTPTLDAMRAIKQLLDPAGILNPGKVLPAA
jgi:D-lactate dehydrogenase